MIAIEIRKLYEQYGFLIHGRCLRILGSEDDAQDAVHDVFARLIENYDRIREPEKVVAWIYRAAQNHCFNVLRQRKRFRGAIDADEVVSGERIDTDLSRRQIIGLALECHDQRVREAVYYTHVEGLSQVDIQKVCGQSPSTIRRNLRKFEKSLPRLRKRLAL